MANGQKQKINAKCVIYCKIQTHKKTSANLVWRGL